MEIEGRKVRFGRVRVDREPLDEAQLDSFLAKVRVFPNYARADHERVQPFLDHLSDAGFQVLFEIDAPIDSNFSEAIKCSIASAAERGWVISFVSKAASASGYVGYEFDIARELGSRLVAVRLENIPLPGYMLQYNSIDAFDDAPAAREALVQELLQRRR